MLGPCLLMALFSIHKWWTLEKKWNLLLTFPFLVLQIFPQYRALRIICLGFQKNASWKKEKEFYDRDLSPLGM